MILRELVKDRGDKTNSAIFVLKPRSCTIWRAMYWTRGSRFRVERKSGCCLGKLPSGDADWRKSDSNRVKEERHFGMLSRY